MNLFDKNRNELSKYFYDLSKASILAAVVIPIFQEKLSLKFGLAGTLITMIFLISGMLIKKG